MGNSNIRPFKTGDKVVYFDKDLDFPSKPLTVKTVYPNDVFGEAGLSCEETGLAVWASSYFRHYEEPAKEPSFKSFLSPMCRVQLRNGFRLIFDEDVVAVKNSTSHILLNQYADDGHVTEAYKNMFDNHLQIVKVFAKPASTDDLFDPSKVGKLLWESPELVAEQAKKEEKIKTIQEEIRATSKVMEDLVKQLKELE